jgi:hypothetical protein
VGVDKIVAFPLIQWMGNFSDGEEKVRNGAVDCLMSAPFDVNDSA